MPRIFISYRRAETEAITGRIHEHLSRAFGENRIFMDVENLKPGEDFRERLRRAVRSSDVLLVIIGPYWVTMTDPNGQRRLDDPDDLVRIEVETGLQRRGMRVIPVLVNSARMPSPAELPPNIRELAFRNAAVVRNNPYFRTDIVYLIDQIKPRRRPWKRIAALLVVLALIVGAALFVLWQRDLLPIEADRGGDNASPAVTATATLDAAAYLEQGTALLQSGQYELAISAFDQALALAPDNASAYYQRGTARESLGDCEGAAGDYSQAITHDATLVDALLGRARMEQSCLNNPEAAITDYSAAAELRPDDPTVHLVLGRLYDQLQRFDEALTSYRRYLELAGDQADPVVVDRVHVLEAQNSAE